MGEEVVDVGAVGVDVGVGLEEADEDEGGERAERRRERVGLGFSEGVGAGEGWEEGGVVVDLGFVGGADEVRGGGGEGCCKGERGRVSLNAERW